MLSAFFIRTTAVSTFGKSIKCEGGNNMKHKLRIIIMTALLALLAVLFYSAIDKSVFNRDQANKSQSESEVIHYKMLGQDNEPGLYSFTNAKEQKLYLHITPETTTARPLLYSIFLNGRQIQCLWNGEAAVNYRTTIEPNQGKTIEITILNVPEGKNMYQFGAVHFPDKLDWNNDHPLRNSAYTMDFTSFTIVRQTDMAANELLTFPYEKSITKSKNRAAELAIIEGDLSVAPDKISGNCLYQYNDIKKLYYHWRNSYDEPVMVRFSLMKDWEQIPWPDSGRLFLDTKAEANDYLLKEIDLTGNAEVGANQYMVVAFINPGISFWYYDQQDDTDHWKANPLGSQGWATLRNIVVK